MILQITRPLIWLDCETHSKVAPEEARIVELGFIKFEPGVGETRRWRGFINPNVPITDDAHAVHGISNEDVKLSPSFAALAANLARGFSGCDFGGYHIKYDMRVLEGEFGRAGVEWSWSGAHLVDGQRLWQLSEPRTLADFKKRFLSEGLREAHRSIEDAEDAMDGVDALLAEFNGLPHDPKSLHELSFPKDPDAIDDQGKLKWINEEPCLTFGKHKGTPIHRVPDDYLEWILKGDFPGDFKQIVKMVMRGGRVTR